ncbi:hypothetical protein [Paraconexibacter algicola]|uniref:Uncharacterized protein n=1 Tax=Paraconexibacter algicola TaxID=2133960 RepID=A0A2T4UE27_9ACTN|nr:hypothetical protein [Paraconexibacter algicola]PTL55753.1 hypothetical protein C7Y72_19175 [Paraconexibacter algicola]
MPDQPLPDTDEQPTPATPAPTPPAPAVDGLPWPTTATKTAKHPALVLTLGGAPASPHVLPGVPGHYRPDRPTVCDQPGGPGLEQARALSANPGAPVALVYLTDKERDAALAATAQDLEAARRGYVDARTSAVGGEHDHLKTERDALKGE